MGRMTFQPKWWNEQTHGGAWDRVKEAMKRDWEQTKHDFKGTAGRELDQDVNDTVKQAAGKDVIPPKNVPNAPGGTPRADDTMRTSGTWDDVESPMAYGYGARMQYGTQHSDWNDNLETSLRQEWETNKDASRRGWNDVKGYVRRGYERARN